MVEFKKVIDVQFYKADSGSLPVRVWLIKLSPEERKVIGDDIRTVEFGWPMGMPLVRKLDKNLWEVRSDLPGNRIARVLFTVYKDVMVLLHAFIKKTKKTPQKDLSTANKRMQSFERKT